MTQQTTIFARAAGIMLAMAMAAPVWSQGTDPASEAAQQENATMADTQAKTPDTTAETFQDWVVRCIRDQDGNKLCEMTQELNDAKTGQRVLAIGIKPTAAADSSAEATIVAPLGLKLAPGILLKIDEAEPINLPFDVCLPAGCIVRAQMDATQISAFSEAKSIGVDMTAPDGKILGVRLSPTGFADAWKRLEEIAAK